MSRYADEDHWNDAEREYADHFDHSPPHSGLGIASCGLALFAFLITGIVFVAVSFMDDSVLDDLDNITPEEGVLILLTLGAMFLALVGVVLGIIGAITPHRNKLFAGLGIGINSLLFLGLIGLMIIGVLLNQ